MKNIWKYLLILTFLVILWDQAVVSSFKDLSLTFHKLGHALTSMIFGSGFSGFKTIFGTSGDVIFGADSWIGCFIIANSGYFASILFCLLILCLKRTKLKNYLVGSTSIIYLGFTIAFASSIGAIVNALIFSLIIILVLLIQKDGLNNLMINILSMSVAAYVVYDTFVGTILFKLNEQLSLFKSWKSSPPADIVKLTELTGFPTFVWGLIWLTIAVISINFVLIKAKSNK